MDDNVNLDSFCYAMRKTNDFSTDPLPVHVFMFVMHIPNFVSNNALCGSLHYDIDVVVATRYSLAITGVVDRTAFGILIKIPPKFALGDPYVCKSLLVRVPLGAAQC